MKVLLLNGSPKADQCIYTALNEVAKTLNEEGVETEIIHVCAKPVGGCIACYACKKLGKCVFNDIVNEVAEKFKDDCCRQPGLLCLCQRQFNQLFGPPVLQQRL